MFRKLLGTLFVFTVTLGLVGAEELRGRITKVDGDKITLQKYKKGEKGKDGEKDGDPVTLKVAKDAKIAKAKFNKKEMKLEAGDEIKEGLKNEIFSKLGEKGLNVRVTEEKGVVSQILTVQFGGGIKKDKDKDKK
jgi:hypothetical protein